MNSARLERFAEQTWYGGSGRSDLLLPLAWAYGFVVRLRRALYRDGWLRAGHPGVPVIVVGNVTVGGTGKTPVVAWIVEHLRGSGFRPGIVSRGYGGQPSPSPVEVTAQSDPRAVGDEPLLLARRTGAPVVVCVDRLAGARALVAAGVNVVVADDGLQHYALARDLEVVVVDGDRRFGNGRLLPAGPLRESRRRLEQAGLVLVNGGAAGGPWPVFRLRMRGAVNLATGERRELARFAGTRCWAVAGIGNPRRFHDGLRDQGLDIEPVPVPDHGVTDLAALRARARRPVLMTEKDAVKYRVSAEDDAWCVPVDLELSAQAAAAVSARVLAAARGEHD